MERVGVSRRLPAAILDWIFILVLVTIGIVIYATVGGARLGMEAQVALGVPMTWETLASEQVWRQYEVRVETMVDDIERMVSENFTDEQARFIGQTLADSMEQYFDPDRLSVQFFLDLQEDDLNVLVDEAFDSILAAGRDDISSQKVNELRAEVKGALDEFGVAAIVPKAIDFVIWLLFLPVLITLLYGLAEAVFGRSPGKLIVGIAIMRDNGESAHSGTFMLRYALKNAPLLLFVLALLLRSPALAIAGGVSAVVIGIGVLVMAGPERQAIYDHIASTAVFRTRGE